MQHTRPTDIALNAVISAAVMVIILYVLLGPQAWADGLRARDRSPAPLFLTTAAAWRAGSVAVVRRRCGDKDQNLGPVWLPSRGRNRFPDRRNHPETKGPASCCEQHGMAKMQFFFDLIWTQSCTRYLASMGQQGGELWSRPQQLFSPWSAWRSLRLTPWMPIAPV